MKSVGLQLTRFQGIAKHPRTDKYSPRHIKIWHQCYPSVRSLILAIFESKDKANALLILVFQLQK